MTLNRCSSRPTYPLPRDTADTQALGVESVTDLRAASPPLLSSALGHKVAGLLKRLCWGVDRSKVKAAAAHASSAYKTISEEDSFRQCVTRCVLSFDTSHSL
jgi:nucleotidyltransferase/DNA polymerase involved in DNA repair